MVNGTSDLAKNSPHRVTYWPFSGMGIVKVAVFAATTLLPLLYHPIKS